MLHQRESLIEAVTAPMLADTFTDTTTGALESLIELLPAIILAAVLLVVGVAVGRKVEPVVANLVGRANLDSHLETSPLGSMLEGSSGSVASAAGVIAKFYVVLFALYVAVEMLGFAEVGAWLETAVAYVPELVAGLAVILVGVVLAEYAADQTRQSEVAEESDYGAWLAAGVKALLYVIVVVIGLEMIGIDLTIVYLLTEGLATALGLGITAALALAIGVAAGFFAKEYAERHFEEPPLQN